MSVQRILLRGWENSGITGDQQLQTSTWNSYTHGSSARKLGSHLRPPHVGETHVPDNYGSHSLHSDRRDGKSHGGCKNKMSCQVKLHPQVINYLVQETFVYLYLDASVGAITIAIASGNMICAWSHIINQSIKLRKQKHQMMIHDHYVGIFFFLYASESSIKYDMPMKDGKRHDYLIWIMSVEINWWHEAGLWRVGLKIIVWVSKLDSLQNHIKMDPVKPIIQISEIINQNVPST